MPANPSKPEQECSIYIDKVLMKTLKETPDGMPLKELIRQTKLLYPVSIGYIKRWIIEYYVELDYVRLEEDVLVYNEKA